MFSIADYISNATTQQKNEWNKNHYNRYTLLLRKAEDKEYIDWVEEVKKTKKYVLADIFKAGVDALKKED